MVGIRIVRAIMKIKSDSTLGRCAFAQSEE